MKFVSLFVLAFSVLTLPRISIAQADLVLGIDSAGTVAISNTGAEAIDFDGYSLLCSTGCLNSLLWQSIEDQVVTDPLAVVSLIGVGGLGFAEANPTAVQLTELTLGSGGILPPQRSISLGRPVNGSLAEIRALVDDGSLSWQWTSPTLGTNSNGMIAAVPEPSGFLSLAVVITLAGLFKLSLARS